MTSHESEPSAWQLLAPITDLVTPMAVRVAATLRLADLVAGGAEHVEDLAERTGTDALGRMLRHLTCHGVFAEPSPGRFSINETADLLRSDHPSRRRMMFDLDEFGGRKDLVFTELMHTVRTGQPAWEAVFGAPFWDYLAADPAMASFDAAMVDSTRTTAATAYDWSGVRHVVDVGGGTGALLAEVLRANIGVRATLVDLPTPWPGAAGSWPSAGWAGGASSPGRATSTRCPPTGTCTCVSISAAIHDPRRRSIVDGLRT